MADPQLGAYHPPTVDITKPQEPLQRNDEDFNLLEIDFNNDSQSQDSSQLDNSNTVQKEDMQK